MQKFCRQKYTYLIVNFLKLSMFENKTKGFADYNKLNNGSLNL